MKIALAQLKSFKGDIDKNIGKHKRFAEMAAAENADIIIFPELSITGYEPTLAATLATTPGDHRLDVLQQVSDAKKITIGAGIPLRQAEGITISMLVFQPGKAVSVYSKKYIHADEEPFFVCGQNTDILNDRGIAMAICYELSIPAHAEAAARSGAGIYLASVAKTAAGVEKSIATLSAIARNYSMTALMVNCVGHYDNFEAAGQSAVWNNKGELLGKLSDAEESLLLLNTATGVVTKKEYDIAEPA